MIRRRPSVPRHFVLAALVCTITALVGTVRPAEASVFSNPATITIPDPNCTDPDAAIPYPSNIVVAGLSGTITDVNVTLSSIDHGWAGDLEVMLVGPGEGPTTSSWSPMPARAEQHPR